MAPQPTNLCIVQHLALAVGLALTACGDAGTGDSGATFGATPATETTPTTEASPTTSVSGQPTSTSGGQSDSDGQTDTSNGPQAEGSTADPDTGPADTGVVDSTDTADTGQTKFDLEADPSDTDATTDGPPLQGSCRPSEIHGASGGFPKYTDPAYAGFLDKNIAVVTTNAQEDGWVLHIVDISGPVPPANLNYAAPRYHNPGWTNPNLGRIYGLTLDSAGNIYVAASTVYGANPNPSKIKKIDATTGAITDFATLPNNGPAFGNLNYDCVSQTIYVSNHEDGRIYQLDMAGQVVSTYRHFTKDVTMGPAADPGEPNGQFTALGDRVWAVQSHAGRLYYSVWNEDSGRSGPDNEIWSVGYVDEAGIPDPTTAKLEFLAPPYLGQGFSNPVSDLSFAATGWMLISQRTMHGDNQSGAHQSTTYEYQYNNGTWELKGTTFIVGELPGSAAGGVDHSFVEDGYVWMTGDALDFYTPDVVYGLQGTPHAGGDIKNSTLIDMDGELFDQDKGEQGDVEIPIPGDAKPVPPPQ